MQRTLLIAVFLQMILLQNLLGQNRKNADEVLAIASTNQVFQDLDPENANSAFGVYVKQIEKKFNQKNNKNGYATAKVYSSLDDLKKSLKNEEIYFLNTANEEYFELKNQHDTVPCLTSEKYNEKHSNCLLITNTDSGVIYLRNIQKQSIGLSKIYFDWLDDK